MRQHSSVSCLGTASNQILSQRGLIHETQVEPTRVNLCMKPLLHKLSHLMQWDKLCMNECI